MNLTRNVATHFLGKVIPALAQLVIIVLGIRVLGKSEFGKYNLMFNSSMIIASLAAGWIQQSILRYFFSSTGDRTIIRNRFYNLAVYGSVVSFIISFILGIIYFNLDAKSLIIFSVFTAMFSIFLVNLTLMQVQFRSLDYAITESAFYLFSIIIAFTCFYFLSAKYFLIFFIAMTISLGILSLRKIFLILFREAGSTELSYTKINRGFFTQMFRYGFPLTIWMLISNLFNLVDRYIINHYYGYEAVGVYSSVYDLIYKVSGFMSLPVLLAYHPAISKQWNEHNFAGGFRLINKALVTEILIMILIFTIVYLLKNFIFNSVFKLNAPEMNKLFIPLALSSMMWQLTMIIQKPLEFNLKQKTMITGILITILLNFILNILLIPAYGYIVAAYTTLVCTCLYLTFIYFYSRVEFKKSLL